MIGMMKKDSLTSGASFEDPKIASLLILAEKKELLSYDELNEALGMSTDDELELFLIQAIQKRIINGRINQMKRELSVTFYQQRAIGRPQWELMQKRLSSLLEGLREVHNTIRNANKTGGNVDF